MKKIVKLGKESVQILEDQKKAFVEKFGREPTGSDPVFFEPDADVPQPISQAKMDEAWNEMVNTMEEMGAPPEMLYAMRKTNRIVTAENKHNLDADERLEWNDAISEYKTLRMVAKQQSKDTPRSDADRVKKDAARLRRRRALKATRK